MITLGIDTAGRTMGVAIMRDDTLLYECSLATGLTHSETLLPAVDAALKAAGLSCSDIDLFAACAGPGSFTGLRIGLAAVKGLAFPANTPCAGVSTLEALASCHTGCGCGTLIAALDARRGEVYSAAFDLQTGTRLLPDTAGPAADLAEFVASCKKPVFFVGDGAGVCYTKFGSEPGVAVCPPALGASRAAGVCLAALQMHKAGNTCPPAALLPDYHRLSQAERERAAREKAAPAD